MKSEKKTDKKTKKNVYSYTAMMMCPRCKCMTKHSLFDYENKLYKCNICKTVHAK